MILEGTKLLFRENRSTRSREEEKGFTGFTEFYEA